MRVFVVGDDVSSALGRHQVCWPDCAHKRLVGANKFGRASWAALRPTDTMTEKTVMLSEKNGRTDSARSGFSTLCQATGNPAYSISHYWGAVGTRRLVSVSLDPGVVMLPR